MKQNTNIPVSGFFQFCKKALMCIMFFMLFALSLVLFFLCICGITFEPNKISNCSAPQNDRLNHSFVKDINVVDNKIARNGCKMAI